MRLRGIDVVDADSLAACEADGFAVNDMYGAVDGLWGHDAAIGRGDNERTGNEPFVKHSCPLQVNGPNHLGSSIMGEDTQREKNDVYGERRGTTDCMGR